MTRPDNLVKIHFFPFVKKKIEPYYENIFRETTAIFFNIKNLWLHKKQ